MISSPPPITRDPSAPNGALFVLVGLAGVATALAYAPSSYLDFYAQRGLTSFVWGSTPSIAAVLALAGGVLSLMRSECGPPIVAGAGAVMAVVVGVSVTSKAFDLQAFLDDQGLRAVALLAAGGLGIVGVVLGLISSRGRGNPGIAVGITVLALGALAGHAARYGLDKVQVEFNVRPFAGVVVLALIAIIGAFVGRYGALVAAAVFATLLPLYLDVARADTTRDRYAAVVGIVIACAGIVVLAMVATVIATRRAQAFGAETAAYGTQPYAADPTGQFGGTYGPATEQVPTTQPYGQQPYGQQVTGQQATGQQFTGQQFTGQQLTGQQATRQQFTGQAEHDVWGDPALTSSTALPVAEAEPASSADTTGAVSTVGQWAADPYGRHQLRYWDGARWTDNVSTNGVSSTDPV